MSFQKNLCELRAFAPLRETGLREVGSRKGAKALLMGEQLRGTFDRHCLLTRRKPTEIEGRKAGSIPARLAGLHRKAELP
jgi:hypothetical protein